MMTKTPHTKNNRPPIFGMRNFSLPKLWLGIWIIGLLLGITLSLMHPVIIPIEIIWIDKIEHFLAYAILSAWAVLIFAHRKTHWCAAITLVMLGITLEFTQGLTDYRTTDINDAIANILGVLLGQCLGFTRLQTLLQRVEIRLR